jgi:HTH-type transcriptional regulator/antitoxin HigA
MDHIKIIKTEQEHEQALVRVMELMDLNPLEESAESDELELLALLIERYEEQAFPIDVPDPIDAIKFRMDQMGLKNKDLIVYIGSAPKVSEILNGRRSLSLNMIRKLVVGLGISADILIREPETKLAIAKDVDCELSSN